MWFSSLVIVLLIQHVISQEIAPTATSMALFQGYFNETYVRKIKGIFDPKLKAYPKKYNTAWDFHHLHHVCIRGGGDGVYYGTEGIERKLPMEVKGDDSSVDLVGEAEWKKVTKNSETLQLIKVKDATLAEFTAAKFYKSSTFFANCFRQPANSSNPAHLMMKLGMANL